MVNVYSLFFLFQAEDGIRVGHVTGVQTCALPISVYALVAGVIVVLPLVMTLTSATFGVVRTFTSVAITQILFHWMFVSLGIVNPASRTGGPVSPHAHHLGMIDFVPLGPADSSATVAMWISHLLAAAVTVWILRRGEQAVRSILTALRRLLFSGTRPEPVPLVHVPARVQASNLPLVTRHDHWPSMTHRGPPAVPGVLLARHG